MTFRPNLSSSAPQAIPNTVERGAQPQNLLPLLTAAAAATALAFQYDWPRAQDPPAQVPFRDAYPRNPNFYQPVGGTPFQYDWPNALPASLPPATQSGRNLSLYSVVVTVPFNYAWSNPAAPAPAVAQGPSYNLSLYPPGAGSIPFGYSWPNPTQAFPPLPAVAPPYNSAIYPPAAATSLPFQNSWLQSVQPLPTVFPLQSGVNLNLYSIIVPVPFAYAWPNPAPPSPSTGNPVQPFNPNVYQAAGSTTLPFQYNWINPVLLPSSALARALEDYPFVIYVPTPPPPVGSTDDYIMHARHIGRR